MTKTSKLKVRRDFGGNEFAWGEDVQAAAAAAAKSLQSWFSNKERPLLSTSQAGFSRKKVMHTRARFPCPGNGRDTSLILRHCEAGQKCWVLEVEWEKGAGLAGSAGVAVFVMPPGKKQDTEAVPPGTWVLPFVLRTGDKISWRTGGAFCHALLWYHHRQNVKTVSPSIDEGLSLHDKLLREGINILSFYLHCSLHSLSGVLAAGWRSYYWSKKWVCFFFLPFFFFFFATQCGMWDLSSPTRDWTCASCIGSMQSQALDHHGSPKPEFSLEALSTVTITPGWWGLWGAEREQLSNSCDISVWPEKLQVNFKNKKLS